MNKRATVQLGIAILAGLVVGALVFAGWPDLPGSSRQTGNTVPSHRTAMQDFVLPDLQGNDVRFSDFVADRPFVITFGQTTCPPCVQQSLVFKELEKKYGDDVAFLKVYIGQSPEVAARQVEQLKSPTKTLIDLQAKIYYRYGKGPIPVTLVGDAEGRIITIGSFFSTDQLTRMLDKQLEAEDPNQPAQNI